MDELYLLAKEWMRIGNYQASIETYDMIIDHYPNSNDIYRVYHNKGHCLSKMGLYNEAIYYYDIAIFLQPNTKTLLNKAFALYQLKNYSDALLTLDNTISSGSLVNNDVLLFYNILHHKLHSQLSNPQLLLNIESSTEVQQEILSSDNSILDNQNQILLGDIISTYLNFD